MFGETPDPLYNTHAMITGEKGPGHRDHSRTAAPGTAGDMSGYLIHTVGCGDWQLWAPFPQPGEVPTGQLAQVAVLVLGGPPCSVPPAGRPPLLRYGTALALEPDKHAHQAVKVQTAGRGKGDVSEVQLRPRDGEEEEHTALGSPEAGKARFR